MPRPSVVILSAFLTPFRSGAEACAEEVALRLSDHLDITIVTAKLHRTLPRNGHLPICPSVNVIRVGLGCSFDKWLYPLLAPFAARKLKPDVIHAILETFAGLALHACKMIVPHAKQILTLQTTNRNFLRRHILRSPDIVTAISKHLANQAATFGRTDAIVIPNGIPYEGIRNACANVKKVPGRILFVGRLEKMKGVDTLLRSLHLTLTLSPNPSPTLELHIVGDGSEKAFLEGLAHELHLNDHLRFLGFISGSELYHEYAEAEIFCGLSRSEALGNVFLEAQAAGCAIVATEVGGIPEIVKNQETGILVSPDDPQAAAGALKKLLEDDSLRQTFAAAGTTHAKGYDWDAIAKNYAAQYDYLLSRTT